MEPKDKTEKLTEADVDGLIRSYGRVSTQKQNVAIITEIMNTTVEDLERKSQAQEEVRPDQVEQAEEAQLEEEQDSDFE